MNLDTVLIILSVFLGLTVLYVTLKQRLDSPKTDPTLNAWLKSLQQSFDSTNRTTNISLQQNYRELFSRLDQATAVISDLKKEAGSFGEVSRSMKDLHDYLKSPKLRGNIGEQVLADLVSQMFPKTSFSLQYHFKSGQIVDVIIKTQAGLLPIDSKFPMENFQKIYQSTSSVEKNSYRNAFVRDVRKHLKDISTKYIVPEEGTLDFALMYIPSESVYYEIVNEQLILNYSRDLRVYPVSPTTLYANLQTILLSLESQKIAGKTTEIFTLLRSIQKDYDKLSENFGLLTKHLTNAYNTMTSTTLTISQIGNKLDSSRDLKTSLIPEKSSDSQ